MDVTPFEQLPITTMTLVVTLNSPVNVEAGFQLLPITRIAVPQTRVSSRCKLRHCSIPGAILSMRWRDGIRGVVRNGGKNFKNSVTIDISTSMKNVNMKLSSTTIQMCGAKSLYDGEEASTHLIAHLKEIQSILDRMQADEAHTQQIIAWIKQITHGPLIERQSVREQQIGPMKLVVHRTEQVPSIARPEIPIPEGFDVQITRFLLSMADDFIYHSDLSAKLDFIPMVKDVVDDQLDVQNIGEVMVNHNYPLGFEVDRASLDRMINGRDGFISHYDNMLSTSVTVQLPYEPADGSNVKRRRNKVPHLSFLVFQSGFVTQSSPTLAVAREGYYKFMAIIHQLRPYIEYRSNRITSLTMQRPVLVVN